MDTDREWLEQAIQSGVTVAGTHEYGSVELMADGMTRSVRVGR